MKVRLVCYCLVLITGIAAGQSGEEVAKRAFGGVQPRVSPDGTRVALSYQGAICVMPAEGGELVRCTTCGTRFHLPAELESGGPPEAAMQPNELPLS